MSSLIKHGLLQADDWRLVQAGDTPANPARAILPLADWQARPAHPAVWLAPDETPDALLPHLGHLTLIAIHFPVFTDGRGYSLARLLRQRHGYRGELRAVGDVLRDQLYFLHACGFDAFSLRADQSPAEAVAALADYRWQPLGQR